MTKKASKLKTIAGLVTILAGITAGGIAYNATKEKTADKQKEQSAVTVQQLEDRIEHIDDTMQKLQAIIDSKDTDPEERFEAYRMYHALLEKRNEIQAQLDKQAKKTILFNDVRDDR